MKHLTGATPSPRYKAFAAFPYQIKEGVPSSWGVIPPNLAYWGNNRYGDCVSAEEAAAKAQYSLMDSNSSELLISDQTLIDWAMAHGYLNGANLTEVMDSMRKDGIISDNTLYKDGDYNSVDWTNDAILSSAIYTGPVKIGIASNQLQNIVGSTNGWWATGFSHDSNMDHCVNLCGFGSAAECAAMLNVSVPSNVTSTTRCYLLFTWSTIGIIDRQSLINITGEAWLRNPTSIPKSAPTPIPVPTPPPTPPPIPVPPPSGPNSVILKVNNWTIIEWLDGTPPPKGAGPHPAKVTLGNEVINITARKGLFTSQDESNILDNFLAIPFNE